MKWFKKIVIAATMALALATPASLPSAQATSYYDPGYVTYYRVYYRTCSHGHWHVYGAYTNPHQAWRVAQWIQNNGYEAFVR